MTLNALKAGKANMMFKRLTMVLIYNTFLTVGDVGWCHQDTLVVLSRETLGQATSLSTCFPSSSL